MAKKQAVSKKNEEKMVPLEFYVPEGIMTPFATNMTVQLIEDEFKVSFFEVKPPIQLDATVPPPNKIRADYVAGVIISAGRIPKFIEVLQQQLAKYRRLTQPE